MTVINAQEKYYVRGVTMIIFRTFERRNYHYVQRRSLRKNERVR